MGEDEREWGKDEGGRQWQKVEMERM